MSIPYFTFYPQDWLGDANVSVLNLEERGAYWHLLCHMWTFNDDCSLPDDDLFLMCLLNVRPAKWKKLKAALLDSPMAVIDREDGKIFSHRLGDIKRKFKIESTRPTANVWRDLREQVFLRDDYTCQYCGERGVKLECDHIDPVCQGGSHDLENLVTACKPCNRSKAGKTLAQWVEWRAAQ